MSRWAAVADGVYARRHDGLDLTTGLVVGEKACLVVDTAGDIAQGTALASAVREITAAPWTIVYTHAHFDHCFGTGAFTSGTAIPTTNAAVVEAPPSRDDAPSASPEIDVWAHAACRTDLVDTGECQRDQWVAHYERAGQPATAAALRASPLVLPTRTVTDAVELDLGGRTAVLAHLGRGHTDHDVVVHVPDTRVVFAGDLVEHGAPPAFEDAYPLDWPGAVRRLLDLDPLVIVPGHGEPADVTFGRRQHDELAMVAALCARHARGDTVDVTASPYPPDVTRVALARPR